MITPEQYVAALSIARDLCALDPELDTLEGRTLDLLAALCLDYEVHHFPELFVDELDR